MQATSNMRKAALALLLGAATAAQAGVSLNNGDFYITYEDIALDAQGQVLAVTRTYNSLASNQGWFGVGWGTPFETRLTVLADGSIDVQRLGSASIAHFRATGEAGKWRLAAGAPMDAARCVASAVERSGEGFRQTNCAGEADDFDADGRLLRHRDADGYGYQLHYQGARPDTVTDTLGRQLRFDWTANGLLAAVRSADGGTSYRYDADNNLVHAVDANGLTYDYAYDRHHNLTRITYIDNSSMRIDYVSGSSGRVAAVVERSGRATRYAYADRPDGITTTRITDADGTDPVTETFEFTDPDTPADGSGRLVGRATGAGRAEFVYHPRTGKLILAIDPQGSRTAFHYDDDGDLRRVEANDGRAFDLYLGLGIGD